MVLINLFISCDRAGADGIEAEGADRWTQQGKKGEKTCNVIGLGRGERSFFYWALSTIIPFLDR